MNRDFRKHSYFFSALLFFSAGVLLLDPGNRIRIVELINQLFSLSLNEEFRTLGLFYTATLMILCGCLLLLMYLKRLQLLSSLSFGSLSVMVILANYLFHLIRNAENYPVFDDQGAILDFLVRYTDTATVSGKLKWLMTPYNECIMTVPRVFSLSWLRVFGELNFMHLIVFNGFLLIFFHWFLFRSSGLTAVAWPWLMGVVLFVFQFQYFDDAFWVISGWSYYGVFFLALLAFFCLQPERKKLRTPALIAALLAAFTFGNGWLVFIIGSLWLLLQKRFREAFVWITVLFLVGAVYFFERSQFHALSAIDWNPVDNLLFVLGFLGSAFQFFYTMHLPVFVGLLIVLVFVWATREKMYLSRPIPYFMLTFLIGSALMASPLRSGIEPSGHYALQVRYGIFSIDAFALALLLFAAHPVSANVRRLVLPAAVSYQMLTGIFFYPEVGVRKERIKNAITEVRAGQFNRRYATFDRENFEQLMKASIRKGIYKP